uniref:STING ligand-binding domain-containing protein n=2 Tax=Clastoptera arizonana TaxID=38151 RepID=A0A1B6DEJ0_9HEMI
MKKIIQHPLKRERNIIMFTIIFFIIAFFIVSVIRKGSGTILTTFSSSLFMILNVLSISRLLHFIPDILYSIQIKEDCTVLDVFTRSFDIKYFIVFLTFLVFAAFDKFNFIKNTYIEEVLIFSFSFEFLNKIFKGLDEYPAKKAMDIEEGISSLATGFYYGYLKIVLPSLSENIELYETKESDGDEPGINFPVKKLFVLIPSQAQVYDKVESLNLKNIQIAKNLMEYRITRGMVKDRCYSNSVYKVKDERSSKLYYCVCEYATPIKTLEEQCREDAEMKKYKREMIYAFYNTLKMMVEADFELKDYVELIYFKGDGKLSNSSDYPSIDELLLTRIKINLHQEKEKGI